MNSNTWAIKFFSEFAEKESTNYAEQRLILWALIYGIQRHRHNSNKYREYEQTLLCLIESIERIPFPGVNDGSRHLHN